MATDFNNGDIIVCVPNTLTSKNDKITYLKLDDVYWNLSSVRLVNRKKLPANTIQVCVTSLRNSGDQWRRVAADEVERLHDQGVTGTIKTLKVIRK